VGGHGALNFYEKKANPHPNWPTLSKQLSRCAHALRANSFSQLGSLSAAHPQSPAWGAAVVAWAVTGAKWHVMVSISKPPPAGRTLRICGSNHARQKKFPPRHGYFPMGTDASGRAEYDRERPGLQSADYALAASKTYR